MDYIHQSTYGHAGQAHTMKAVMAVDHSTGHVYEMKNGARDTKAIYAIRNNKMYQTGFHPAGESLHAMYTIQGSNIHTTLNHPQHNPVTHVMQFRAHP